MMATKVCPMPVVSTSLYPLSESMLSTVRGLRSVCQKELEKDTNEKEYQWYLE